MHGNAVSDARLYNRSLMGGPDAPYMPQGVPPVPPMRGMASYNGARTGSFASFGHPASHFGAPIQVNKNFFSCSYIFISCLFTFISDERI